MKHYLILVLSVSILMSLPSCASNKRNARNKPCDCPEFDNKPPKRKKHSFYSEPNTWIWQQNYPNMVS